jgi:hypothetical protein
MYIVRTSFLTHLAEFVVFGTLSLPSPEAPLYPLDLFGSAVFSLREGL